jgi:hypothetical protein
MAKKKAAASASDRITLRVTPDINHRADALVQAIAHDAATQGFTRVTRAVVLKRALLRGLDSLEQEYK